MWQLVARRGGIATLCGSEFCHCDSRGLRLRETARVRRSRHGSHLGIASDCQAQPLSQFISVAPPFRAMLRKCANFPLCTAMTDRKPPRHECIDCRPAGPRGKHSRSAGGIAAAGPAPQSTSALPALAATGEAAPSPPIATPAPIARTRRAPFANAPSPLPFAERPCAKKRRRGPVGHIVVDVGWPILRSWCPDPAIAFHVAATASAHIGRPTSAKAFLAIEKRHGSDIAALALVTMDARIATQCEWARMMAGHFGDAGLIERLILAVLNFE